MMKMTTTMMCNVTEVNLCKGIKDYITTEHFFLFWSKEKRELNRSIFIGFNCISCRYIKSSDSAAERNKEWNRFLKKKKKAECTSWWGKSTKTTLCFLLPEHAVNTSSTSCSYIHGLVVYNRPDRFEQPRTNDFGLKKLKIRLRDEIVVTLCGRKTFVSHSSLIKEIILCIQKHAKGKQCRHLIH